MKILDPQFKYIPAAATDVAATWKRFGFSARANEARREALRRQLPAMSFPRNARSAILVLCTSALAACAELAPQPSHPLPAWRDGVTSPVFVHEPIGGGDVSGEVTRSELAYSRDVAYRDCLSMHAIGQRAAASFGTGLRGRSELCETAMPAGR